MERRVGAVVVHEGTGVLGLELVDERFARLDCAHLVVPGDLAGVEVDGVADRPVVDQREGEEVADLAAQGGARHGALDRIRDAVRSLHGETRPLASAEI